MLRVSIPRWSSGNSKKTFAAQQQFVQVIATYFTEFSLIFFQNTL